MEEFEFVWLIEGDAQYTWADTVVDAPEGSVVLCRPGATDFFRWDTARRTRHAYFHFQVKDVPSNWPDPAQWPLVREFGDDQNDIVRPMFRHLLTLVGPQDAGPDDVAGADAELVRLTILHMLRAFVTGQTHASHVRPQSLPDAVERAGAYLMDRLESDPAADITLDDLAGAACVTPEHLCRVFRTSTGLGPVATVRLARLDRAAVLLARSNYAVAQIARQCGFASPFHFSRAFKCAYGHSPRDLRKRLEAGETPPTPRLLRFTPWL